MTRKCDLTVISVGNFREFLAPGAHNPVNVDGTITELVRNRMEVNPTRYVFDEAQVEIDRFYLWINFLIELKDNYLPFLYVIKGEIYFLVKWNVYFYTWCYFFIDLLRKNKPYLRTKRYWKCWNKCFYL